MIIFISIILRYNSCTIRLTPLNNYKIRRFFSIFVELCNHHPCLILEHFLHSERNPIRISSYSQFPLPQSPKPQIYLLSLWICLLWTFHIVGSGLLCLASFTKNNVVRLHPCCSIYEYSVPFYSWMGYIVAIHVPYFVTVDEHLACFYFLALMKKLLWTSTHKSLCGHIFNSPGYACKSGLAHHCFFKCCGWLTAFSPWSQYGVISPSVNILPSHKLPRLHSPNI